MDGFCLWWVGGFGGVWGLCSGYMDDPYFFPSLCDKCTYQKRPSWIFLFCFVLFCFL